MHTITVKYLIFLLKEYVVQLIIKHFLFLNLYLHSICYLEKKNHTPHKYILCGPILPCVPTMWEGGPGPIFRVRGDWHPRTSSRGMYKITVRGEEEHVGKELGRVRERRSPRYFCPRCLVNLLITQNNV